MRDRLLIRHFLWRFLEHEVVSASTDRHTILSAVAGALLAISLFAAVLVAWPYQLFPSMPPGLTSLRALDERFLFMSSSMLVMALAAVVQWDALMLDATDTAALGILPIPRSTIVRTKFAATALFAAAVVVAWNFCPTLLRAAAMPAGLRVGIVESARLTLAHGVVALVAGAFGFLAVLGLRETLFAIVGPARFGKISAALQAVLIVGLTTALLLLPGASDVATRWRADPAVSARAVPSSWFVGLHETLAGSVIDSVPRTRPGRLLIRQELAATSLYRSLWPLYRDLAVIAIAALSLVAIVTIAVCLWNSRRLPTAARVVPSSNRTLSRMWNWTIVHLVARRPLSQAGFFFTLQTLSRRVTHRVALATAWAVGLAMIVVASGGSYAAVDDARSIPLAILAAQSLLLGSVLGGFRRATRLPSELRASTTFRLASPRDAVQFISGVKRGGWISVVLPALCGLSIWHIAVLGPRLAALHFVVGAAISALAIEVMFFRDRRLPFVLGYASTVDVKVRLAGSVTGLVAVSFLMAWFERQSFSSVTAFLALLGTLVVVGLILAVLNRVFSGSTVIFDVEDDSSLLAASLNLTM